ncbi:MAG: hypothetical protein QXZ48_01590 [Zestosphaera sp.]
MTSRVLGIEVVEVETRGVWVMLGVDRIKLGVSSSDQSHAMPMTINRTLTMTYTSNLIFPTPVMACPIVKC